MTLTCCLVATCAAQRRNAEAEYREFRDSRGRAIEARVLAVRGDKVTIERRDGRQFTVAISTFPPIRASSAAWPAPGAAARVADGRGFAVRAVWGSPTPPACRSSGIRPRTSPGKPRLPGPGASSPITWGDRAYVTCYSGYFIPDQPGGSLDQLRRHLIAIRLTDGQILWDQTVAANLPEEERIRDHGYAASTPAADAGRVYVFFGKSGVFAFDHDGNQLWRTDVGTDQRLGVRCIARIVQGPGLHQCQRRKRVAGGARSEDGRGRMAAPVIFASLDCTT